MRTTASKRYAKTKENSVGKILAAILLAPPTVMVIAFVYNFILQVQANTIKIDQTQKDIHEMRLEVKQVHWYLIESKNVKVPDFPEERSGKPRK